MMNPNLFTAPASTATEPMASAAAVASAPPKPAASPSTTSTAPPSVSTSSSSSRSSNSALHGTLLETQPYLSPGFLTPPAAASMAGTSAATASSVAISQKKKKKSVVVRRRGPSTHDENDAEELTAVGVISHHEALELLCLRDGLGGRGGKKGYLYHEGVSLDLGRSETMVVVLEEGIAIPAYRTEGGNRHHRRGDGGGSPALVATWEELEDIVAQSRDGQLGCYALYADGTQPWRVSAISLQTGRAANLVPSLFVKGPPTVVLGSFLMHRLDGPRPGSYIGPAEDTRRKLDAIKMKKVYGKVLDTTTGLGYTAIAAARCSHVSEVVTIEADQASIEMSRYNPWSSDLFATPSSSSGLSPIRLVQGDVCELVKGFGDGSFAAVMHDPPAMALSKATSNLYAPAFYAELYRVLRWRGRLFHFVGGHPKAKESGRLYKTVVQRLEAAGFKKVMILASAQGVVAEKGEDRKSKKALHARTGAGGGGSGGGERERRDRRALRDFCWGMDFLEDGGVLGE